jgi:type I restriction enzyme S subunit
MRSNYKQVGQYISEVNIKNTNLEVDLLLGVSITKKFIPSIANTIGTDMSKYKIVRKNQFGYGPITSRNGDKISVALLTEEQCIISTSYRVFEIKDHEELDPEYLMMWFRRPEFDRYARFMSHGSTRESFDWDEMCETELPVPYIENQREIVKEYNTIVNRIKLNKQLNQKLEETAQALYKHWFVDFEFPNEDGQPYKSSGGQMVYSEELDCEVPTGWSANQINSFSEISSSKRIFQSEYVSSGIPFYRGKEISIKKSGKPITDLLYISESRYLELKSKYGKPAEGDILLTAVGTIGSSYWVEEEEFYFKDGNVIWFKNFKNDCYPTYLYALMQSSVFKEIIEEITIGSTQSAITIAALGEKNIVSPPNELLKKFEAIYKKLHATLSSKNRSNLALHELREISLAKMSKVESIKTEQVL